MAGDLCKAGPLFVPACNVGMWGAIQSALVTAPCSWADIYDQKTNTSNVPPLPS